MPAAPGTRNGQLRARNTASSTALSGELGECGGDCYQQKRGSSVTLMVSANRCHKKEPRMASYHTPAEWDEWRRWLSAGLHGRSRGRLAVLMGAMLLAGERIRRGCGRARSASSTGPIRAPSDHREAIRGVIVRQNGGTAVSRASCADCAGFPDAIPCQCPISSVYLKSRNGPCCANQQSLHRESRGQVR